MKSRDDRAFADVDPTALSPGRRRLPWLRQALIFVVCLLMANAVVGERGLAETLRARREYRAVETALSALKTENARLRNQVEYLQHDLHTIEALARGELGLIRPGEILFVLKDRPERP